MKRRGIIDRFEGELAVIEFENGMEDIHRSLLPENVQVHDVIYVDEAQHITIAKAETKQLKQDIQRLMDELFED